MCYKIITTATEKYAIQRYSSKACCWIAISNKEYEEYGDAEDAMYIFLRTGALREEVG